MRIAGQISRVLGQGLVTCKRELYTSHKTASDTLLGPGRDLSDYETSNDYETRAAHHKLGLVRPTKS